MGVFDLADLAPKKTVIEAIESLAAATEAILTTLPPELVANLAFELKDEVLDFIHWRQNGGGVQ